MELKVFFVILFILGLGVGIDCGVVDNEIEGDDFPQISSVYMTQGTLYIPYAEIEETFSAWVDQKKGLSRIDFYGGVSKTYQLGNQGEFGSMRKVVPMTTDSVTNELTCFEVNGTADSKVEAQSIIPNPTGFKYAGKEVVNGQISNKYVLEETKGQKVNKYSYWVRILPSTEDPSLETGIPIKYEMKGYNTLLGSHYDHYYLQYDWFSSEQISQDIFNVPESMVCGSFPGPGASHHLTKATFNPMKEFIHGFDDHINNGFYEFIHTHNKQYKHDKEMEKRRNIFRHNFRFIHSHNRKGLTFKLGLNHLADKSDDERKVLRGKLYSRGYNGGSAFPYSALDMKEAKIPQSIDWRLYGAVTPVKDQSVCGSCWSFGTIGAVEGANFLKTGNLVRLSQQALIDCSWGEGNNGCDGGEDFRAYKWMIQHGGIPAADSYGPYLGIDGFCHISKTKMATTITGYVNVTSGDEDALKMAIFKHGPVSVAIDASHKTFSFYANGVYFEPKCGKTEDALDHAVLAVGFGTLKNEPYWLVKNSWSNYWGNDGYVLMSQKENNCGVATSPTYVTL